MKCTRVHQFKGGVGKGRCTMLRESIAQDKEKTDSLKVQVQSFEKEIEEVDAKIDYTEEKLKDLHKLQDQVTEITATRSASFKEQERRYQALDREIEETDEELKEWKETFDDKICQQDLLVTRMERERSDLEEKIKILGNNSTEIVIEISKLQSEAEDHASLKKERDAMIRKLFSTHNLGSLPDSPFSDETTLSCSNRLKVRISELEKAFQEKKISNKNEINAAKESYQNAYNRLMDAEAKRDAKEDTKDGISKRIQEKESERKSYEVKISDVDLRHLDERERNARLEMERKTNQLAERNFDSIINEKQQEIYSLDHRIMSLNREKEMLEGDSENQIKLAVKKSELEKKREIMDVNKDKIRGVLKGRLPPEKVLKKEIDQALRSVGSEFEDVHLKSREAEKEVTVLQLKIQEQRLKSATSTENMKKVATLSESTESIFHQLDNLRVVYEEYTKLSKETIPQAEADLAKLNEELEQKTLALDDILGIVAQVKADKDSIEALVPHVDTADWHSKEIQNLLTQVDEIEGKLHYSGLGVKSTDEIKSELGSLQKIRYDLQIDVNNLREEQRYMEATVTSANSKYFSAREEKMNTAALVNNLRKAEEELESLMEEKNKAISEEKQLAEAISPLKAEYLKLSSDYDALQERLGSELEKEAELLRSQRQEVEDLLKLNSRIKGYNEIKKAERLKEFQSRKSQAESELQKCEQRKKNISDELNNVQETRRNHELLAHTIKDNISYREVKARVDELTRELELLEQRQLEIGSANIYMTELKKLKQERDRLLSEYNRFHGTMSVYESNISKNKIDLKQPQYKDIDKRYFDQLIQLKTTEMANKDLDRYYNALDKALMRFHTMKMEEINKIIRELWQQTYRGQDIDYIYIHSDSEGAGTRSYSYKVLMQTGDAELEMRGRCSAGQKVLASLIIRLALAETFCLNCGILALDEPTTNLDGPNSESLAAALLRIMEDRKGQENFQLIVITHDERFAQLIGQRQHAEKYYRVHKDEHQHSIISAQEIFD
ncbi:DNA repair protein RAD50 [Bienertia sinuspersici]